MGTNSQTGRARRRAASAGTGAEPEVVALIERAVRYAQVSDRAVAPLVADLNAIGSGHPHLDPVTLLIDGVRASLRSAWEDGWQPLELVHATRRRTSSAGATWVARAVLAEAAETGVLDCAPDAWAEQIRSLIDARGPSQGWERLLPTGGRASVQQWSTALVAFAFLRVLPPTQPLLPPPSQWDRAPSPGRAPRPAGEQHAKTLTRIRGLLAKAESTDFEAEADALTAKAQHLMTRYAIDEAMVAADAGDGIEVNGARILIHHPYGVEKASLLTVIARANRSRAVWHEFSSVATLVGVPTDVAQVEMLFTSALVQATRAMTRAGEHSHQHDRSSSFRKAFLSAYATRIGERLETSNDEATAAYGDALVPVLQRQAEAIDAEFDRLFPHVTTGRRRRSFDARGWDAGTRAADEAVLPAGEVGPAAG